MSYTTEFTLNIQEPADLAPELTDRLLEELAKLFIFPDGDPYFGYTYSGSWYRWEEDMATLSSRFPSVLFCLHGAGENAEDLWDAYFRDGLVQHCPAQITYPPFDPDKLAPAAVSGAQ